MSIEHLDTSAEHLAAQTAANCEDFGHMSAEQRAVARHWFVVGYMRAMLDERDRKPEVQR